MQKNQLIIGNFIMKTSLPIVLRAGDLFCTYCDGSIRNVMAGDIEVVRRIYAAVRDKYWNTITPEIKNVSVEKKARSFRIEFDCRHSRNEIRFGWHGTIEGSDDNTISFSMQGIAGPAFDYNRIGMCVLHPLKECAGKKVMVETISGSKEISRFPALVEPRQPFKDIRALRQRFGHGISGELRFFGNVFETEDQRNWTDASFKTYCPPLLDNIPFRMKKGEKVSQGVLLRVKTQGQTKNKSSTTKFIHVDFSIKKAFIVPEIGTAIPDQIRLYDKRELQLLQACRFSHLRVNVPVDDKKLPEIMKTAAAYSKALSMPLELALYFRKEKLLFNQDVKRLEKVFGDQGSRVKRFLVFRKGEKVTSHETIRAVIDMLRKCAPKAAVITGADRYFVEINRNRPHLENCDGVCYSANPQVHAFDDSSVIDNLEGQPHTVRAAKNLFPGKDIFLTPITLRPRPVPESPQKDHGPDARQKTLFGAAWTLGSIIRLAEAGVSGVTYFETTGDCGIMEKNGARVFPMYQVFADIGEFAGGNVRVFQDENRRTVEACILETKNRKRCLIANMTQEKRDVLIHDPPDTVSVKYLDRKTVSKACLDSDQFRKNPGRKLFSLHGRLRISLGPYAIARIDFA